MSAEVKVDEQIVGPVVTEHYNSHSPYVVSPRGVRLATVVSKGSRMVVVVDGVEGPRFDEIKLVYPCIDMRPLHEAQRAAALAGQPGLNITLQPVVFSKDGKRFAYVGRSGQEWVLIADGKEIARFPTAGTSGMSGAFGVQQEEFRLELTGDNGKHLMFSRTVFGGYEFWVDGQKMPALHLGGLAGGADEPTISADGARFAYVGLADQKHVLVVDGKVASYLGALLRFTGDSKHLICVAQLPNEHQVLMDGKPILRAPEISDLYVAPAGSRIIAAVRRANPNGEMATLLMVDGKAVETTNSVGPLPVVFSPDGKRYATIAGRRGAQFVVTDGNKGQEYFQIQEGSLTFSADSQKVGYVAWTPAKRFVVINDAESEGFDHIANFLFSPDGKRVAYSGNSTQPHVFIDGAAEKLTRNLDLNTFVFSPNGSRYAYLTEPNKEVVLDGKATGLRGKFAFSPDSKHFAVHGNQPSAQGLFVDGQHVWGTFETQNNLRYRAFTPDGQHLYWMHLERSADASGKAMFEWVTCLDGKPVARCDRSPAFGFIYGTDAHTFLEPAPAWEIGADGTLVFLGPVGDSIKRFKITPSTDTSITEMLSAGGIATAPLDRAPAAGARQQILAALNAVTLTALRVPARAQSGEPTYFRFKVDATGKISGDIVGGDLLVGDRVTRLCPGTMTGEIVERDNQLLVSLLARGAPNPVTRRESEELTFEFKVESRGDALALNGSAFAGTWSGSGAPILLPITLIPANARFEVSEAQRVSVAAAKLGAKLYPLTNPKIGDHVVLLVQIHENDAKTIIVGYANGHYHANAKIGTAAIHAGIARVGETVLLRLTYQPPFTVPTPASEQNGIKVNPGNFRPNNRVVNYSIERIAIE